MANNSRPIVAAPVRLDPKFSLLSSAFIREEWDDRFLLGITFDPDGCDVVETRAGVCATTSGDFTYNEYTASVDFDSFSVVAGKTCSTMGTPGLRSAVLSRGASALSEIHEAAARASLDMCRHKAVEKEFWTGEQRTANGMSGQGLVDVPVGGVIGATVVDTEILEEVPAVSPLAALMLIEQNLADSYCGGRVFIHIPRAALGSWIENNYIRWDQDYVNPDNSRGAYMTYSGHVVVAGSGYDGSAPTVVPAGTPDPADTSVWIYVTSPVIGYKDDVNILAHVDHRNNDVYALAAQQFVLAWDRCVHLAVRVDCCG